MRVEGDGAFSETIGALKKEPELGKFRFRASNKWLEGGHCRTTIKDFYGTGQVHEHARPFEHDADEPPVLLGEDGGANPVEYLLTALASCLTTTMIYHAASRGIRIDSLESEIEGDIDVRAFTGITDEVPKGYQEIRITFRVESDAPAEKLAELAQFSPVFDTITRAVPVTVNVRKK